MGDHSDEQPLLQSVTVEDHDSAMLSLQSKTKSRNGLGLTLLRRLGLLLKLGFPSVLTWMALRFFIIAALQIAAAVGLGFLGQLGGPFIKAVLQLDAPVIWKLFATALSYTAAITIAIVVSQYMAELLRLDWRKAIVEKAHQAYFRNRMLYWVNVLDGKVDNTDQRITEDVEQFTVLFGAILFGNYNVNASIWYILAGGAMNTYFVVKQLSPTAVWMVLGYWFTGMVLTTCLLVPVSRSTFWVNETVCRQLLASPFRIQEGDFRFQHARLKEFSECVAFYDGQEQEHENAQRTFSGLYKRFNTLFLRQFALETVTLLQSNWVSAYGMLTIIIVLTTGDGDINGTEPTAGNIQNALSAIQQLISALSALPTLYSQMGAVAGYAHRVGQIFQATRQLKAAGDYLDEGHLGGTVHDSADIRAVNMLCRSPAGKVLLKALNFHLKHPESLIIMGPSGAGKSSVLRVIGGLWPFDAGELHKPSVVGMGGMFFVPQRPYISQGTLRDQVIYPDQHDNQTCSDQHLEVLLKELGLAHLVMREGGLDCNDAWSDSLSMGEQQRLGFARLYYHAPRFAILDEATSALPVDMEARCMQLCKAKGISCISVGHRPTLLRFHDTLLQLDGLGGYKLRPVTEEDINTGDEDFATETADYVEDARDYRDQAEMQDDALMEDEPSSGSGRRGSQGPILAMELEQPLIPTMVQSVTIQSHLDEEYNPWSANVFQAGGSVNRRGSSHHDNDDDDDAQEVAMSKGEHQLSEASKSEAEQSAVTIDKAFFRRFWVLFRYGFPKILSKPTMVFILACLLNATAAVVIVLVQGLAPVVVQRMTDLDFHGAVVALITLGIAFTLVVLLASGCNWLGRKIGIYWYRALVEHLEAIYFKNKVIYAANTMVPTLDNCDQRIVTDTRLLAQSFCTLMFGGGPMNGFVMVIMTVLIATYYTAQSGWFILTCCYAYTILGMIGTHFMMRPLISLTYLRNKREGDFRFSHARLREYAESIVFYNGQDEEARFAATRFGSLYAIYKRYIHRNFPLRTLNNFQVVFGGVVGIVFYAIQVLSFSSDNNPPTVQETLTSISLAGLLLGNLVLLPKFYTSFIDIVGYAHRVGQMMDKSADVLSTYEWFDEQHMIEECDEIQIDHVTCRNPGGAVLYRDLTFSVPHGVNTLIMGPSGSGKSSLLRLVGGLWPFERGLIRRPTKIGRDGLFFVPQRPYISDSTLRAQMIYPDAESRVGDDVLQRTLEELDLGHLALRGDGLDERCRWADQLSGGEQQRIGFARLLYHAPKYAFMDESTSALDVDLEEKCMHMCREAGITCISVAHRPSLLKYHQQLLRLDGEGGFSVESTASPGSKTLNT